MPQKRNRDFNERYPYVRFGKLVSMRITDVLTKNSAFVLEQCFKT